MTLEPRPRVLLVDDHRGVLSVLQHLLERSCDVVDTVTRGTEVLEATARLQPDVVVLDVFIPGIDGWEVCRQIRSAMPATKVVVISAALDPDFMEKAVRMGATGFVQKSSAATNLLNAIYMAFRGKALGAVEGQVA